MDITDIFVAVIGVVLPFGVGFIAGQWNAIRRAAAASPNPFDDKLVEAVESLAEKIVRAKLEAPDKPLGEG